MHVDVNGLDPARDYFYRFRAGREVSQIGRTRTAPAAGASVDTLRFAMVGCNHYETGYFTAFRRIAEDNVDFVFHTGDYIYEERDNGGRTEVVRQHQGQEIYTLVDYRNRYALYKMDADLRAAHASAPFIITWDDHEVDNDYAGNRDEQDTPPEVFLLRRAAAYQAFYEHMPLRPGAFPTGPDLKLYRRLTFGSLVDFSVLDTRQYRSNQACEGGAKPGCSELRDDQPDDARDRCRNGGCSKSSDGRARAGRSSASRCRCSRAISVPTARRAVSRRTSGTAIPWRAIG